MMERRVLISKQMAQAELQPRMEVIKLPKHQLDTFYRRYDIFEKTAYKTSNGFNKSSSTRSSVSKAKITTSSESFYRVPSQKQIDEDEANLSRPFQRNVNMFKIKNGNIPQYRSLSAKAMIDMFKVGLVLTRSKGTMFLP
jgi:hypothetical protein